MGTAQRLLVRSHIRFLYITSNSMNYQQKTKPTWKLSQDLESIDDLEEMDVADNIETTNLGTYVVPSIMKLPLTQLLNTCNCDG